MRTNSQIQQIKNNITDPYAISDFVSHNDLKYLINLFKTHELGNDIIKKNTGPSTLNLDLFLDDPVILNLINRLKEVHLNKNKMDFSLIICIEDINEEINEFINTINRLEIVSNQNKIADNLLYGLILTNDPLLWVYFNQKYITFYN